jgi:hypothetical protein
MSDALLYEISKSEVLPGEPFTKRENVYVLDQNNGSYTNNQIILDLAALSNSGKWCDWANAYVAIPLLITMVSATDFSAIATDFAVNLKNGFHQLVNSVNVEYNNTSVVQVSNLTNMYISYKLNTTLSLDDLTTIGSQIGFRPDGFQSWSYRTVAGSDGIGSCNNVDNFGSINAASAFSGTESNNGYFLRQLDTTFTSGQLGVSTLLGGSWQSVSSQFAKSYTTPATIVGGVCAKSWNILATIRLKDISDFFAQMPLTRNAYIKMYVNLNQSLTTLRFNAPVGGIGSMYINSSDVIVYGGQTNPLLVASCQANCGMNPFGAIAGAKTMTLSVSVLNSLDISCPAALARNTMLTSCRLYANLYTMNPLKEEEYLAQRTKTIRYKDIFQYQFLSVQGSFNFLVSNGISRLQEIVLVPLISSSYNADSTGANSFSPLRSPFCSEPASCSPLQWVNNFNIQISGVNVFTNNEQYGYEQFQNELLGVGSINGAMIDGTSSGLISQTAFYNNYGYLVANVARRLPEDNSAKSVQISGTCLAQNKVDLYVFCVFEKSITIDTYNGRRVE